MNTKLPRYFWGTKREVFSEGYGRVTGMGFYLIQAICNVYGWNIKETGHFGKGVHFQISIPKIGLKH